MSAERPNVLFLSIDALRADRTTVHGYGRPTTPRLEALAGDAVVCDQATSIGAFTQLSFHSFMTSSRPLSYGGYDRGGWDRPKSVFRAFKDGGYETISVATFPWVSRYFGYGDGAVDRESHLFVLNTLIGIHGSATMASALRAWHRGEMSAEEALVRIEPMIQKVFEDVDDYCHRRLDQAAFDRLDFADSPLMNEGYDYGRVLKVLARHRAEFAADQRAYLERHLTYVPRAHEWIARDWRLCRRPAKLFREAARRLADGAVALADPGLARLRRHRFKRYVDGADLADRVLREIGARAAPDRPFFLWTHFIDTHVPYCAGRGRRWYRQTPRYLEALGYPADIDLAIAVSERPETETQWAAWSAFYDAAVRYIDEQVGRIIDGLDRMGLRDDTLVVVSGDHGEELGEHGDISHHFRLYEHNVRVPLLFHRPGTGRQRIGGLVTLLDLAPTMAHMAGLPPDPGWEGTPVTDGSVADRGHVVLETFHGGSCLFDRRPPYMAVRTRQWKYLWKEYLDPTDLFSPDGPELYDIAADPMERHNLYRPDHPVVPGFNALIAGRLAEIPEIPKERILAAFGEETAVAATADAAVGAR